MQELPETNNPKHQEASDSARERHSELEQSQSLSIPSEVDLLYPTVCALRVLGGSGRKAELVRRLLKPKDIVPVGS